MDRAEIKELLKEVLGPNILLVDHTKWVSLCCPLAQWTHAGGSDASPSAGVSIREGETSIFHCWGCGSKGSVSWLLKQLEKYTGENYGSLIRTLERGEFLGGTLPEWGAKKRMVEDRILDPSYLDLYDSADGHWYLMDRGLDPQVTRDLQLLVDPEDSDGDERILFPVFDRGLRLQGFSGRAVLQDARLRVRDYHGFQKANALLGIHLVPDDAKEIIVVEGLFDMAFGYQYGYNVVATMHAGLTERQRDILVDVGLPVVLMYDNDAAGETAMVTGARLLWDRVPVSRVVYPEKKRAKGGGWVCPPKDPGDCTLDEMDLMIAQAQVLTSRP